MRLRPIRKTASGKVFGSATTVGAITVTAQAGDVYVLFRDGPGGQILWEMEADNSAGSSHQTFPGDGLFFPNGIYADVVEDLPDRSLKSYCVAIHLPQAVGT